MGEEEHTEEQQLQKTPSPASVSLSLKCLTPAFGPSLTSTGVYVTEGLWDLYIDEKTTPYHYIRGALPPSNGNLP